MLFFKDYKGEPDKKRFVSALKRESVDRVPNFELLIESEHVKRIIGKFVGDTASIDTGLAKPDKLKSYDYSNLKPMNANYYIDVCNTIGQDAMLLHTSVFIPFKKSDKEGRLVNVPFKSIKNRRDYSRTIIDTENQIKNLTTQIRDYKKIISIKKSKIGIGIAYGPILQMLYEFVVGLNDFMIMCYDNIGFVEEMLDAEVRHCQKITEMVLSEKVDFILIADDIAYKTGLFLPPKLMKEKWIPRLVKIIEPVVNANIPVLFHSDGKLDEIIEDLIEVGIDGINPMDPYSIDYNKYKKNYGKYISFVGNIDIQFPLTSGTPDDVKRSVIEHLKIMMPGGGYILSSSHSIANHIPFENFVAMINTGHEYGGY